MARKLKTRGKRDEKTRTRPQRKIGERHSAEAEESAIFCRERGVRGRERVHISAERTRIKRFTARVAFSSVPSCKGAVLGFGVIDFSLESAGLFLTKEKGVFFLSFLASVRAPLSMSISAHAQAPLSQLTHPIPANVRSLRFFYMDRIISDI